jgi:hypothetical protein
VRSDAEGDVGWRRGAGGMAGVKCCGWEVQKGDGARGMVVRALVDAVRVELKRGAPEIGRSLRGFRAQSSCIYSWALLRVFLRACAWLDGAAARSVQFDPR